MIAVPLLFAVVILFFIVRGIFSYRSLKFNKITTPPNGLSIVIPFRNEAKNLEPLLNSLASQNCALPYEVILVNDGSDDGYESVLESFEDHSLSLILKNSDYSNEIDLSSKQQAIDTGVSCSQYDWLIFTDADMTFTPDWLSNLTKQCDSNSTPFIYGRTSIIPHKSILAWIQTIQLDFLFGTAWLFSLIGLDSSCMGNNIAVSKRLYEDIGGQAGLGFTIVEDKKLLSAIKSKGITPKAANPFIADARTYPVDSPKIYLHQMLRWLKGGGGESWQILLIVILLGGELISIIAALFSNSALFIGIVLSGVLFTWLLFILVFTKLKPLKRAWQLPLFLFILLLESLFVIPSLIFITPRWKGRSLRKKGN